MAYYTIQLEELCHQTYYGLEKPYWRFSEVTLVTSEIHNGSNLSRPLLVRSLLKQGKVLFNYFTDNYSMAHMHIAVPYKFHYKLELETEDIRVNIPHYRGVSSEPQSPVLQASISCRRHSSAAGVLLRTPCASPPRTAEPDCLSRRRQWNAAAAHSQKCHNSNTSITACSQPYVTWYHTVLSATRQQWYSCLYSSHLRLVLNLGWVDLAGWLHTEMVYLPEDSHPSQ